jgi:hypothetical protein
LAFGATAVPSPAPLPLEASHGVRVVLEGTDLAAVEAAAAELKARFGKRFAVTARRPIAQGRALQISASLAVCVDDALDTREG